jgi:putative glutathione S-transferase
MGMLINGIWHQDFSFPTKDGAFSRPISSFRDQIGPDLRFQAEHERYHLIVSYACPWAQRTLIMRQLKSLETMIPISVVCPDMLEHGWTWSQQHAGSQGFSLYQDNYLYQLYQRADPKITTRVTVPILWDKKLQTIVNNESSDIIRIFNQAFNDLSGNHHDYYPEALQSDIDRWNDIIYPAVNNGVYRCGFATTQEAYDHAIDELYGCLDTLEAHFRTNTTLVQNELTEADIRLLPTLLRFDDVYHTHFKCSRKRIGDYKNINRYLGKMLETKAIKATTHRQQIKRHYYYSHRHINPYQIIAASPVPQALDQETNESTNQM